jgi:hypothetical protein
LSEALEHTALHIQLIGPAQSTTNLV